MNDERRAQTLGYLYFGLSEAFERLAKELTTPGAKDAAIALLKTFRSKIEGDRTKPVAKLAEKWPPTKAADLFGDYAQLLRLLSAELPLLTTYADDLDAYLAALKTSATTNPDNCATLDRLLEANVAGLWHQFNLDYWTRYRDRLKANARAEEVAVLRRDYLGKRIGDLYHASRQIVGTNNEVLGALVEEAVREIVESIVFPLSVSSGGFFGPASMKQVDVLVWDRHRGPPAIEVGNIAVVPPGSVRALVEVKASCDSTLSGFGLRLTELDAELAAVRDLFEDHSFTPGALGIIVWSDHSKDDVLLQTQGRACILFQRDPKDGSLKMHNDQVDRLLTFLKEVLGVYNKV